MSCAAAALRPQSISAAANVRAGLIAFLRSGLQNQELYALTASRPAMAALIAAPSSSVRTARGVKSGIWRASGRDPKIRARSAGHVTVADRDAAWFSKRRQLRLHNINRCNEQSTF